MQEITGSTAEEKRLIKAIQRAIGALDNGVIGTDTMTSIAARVGADCWPIAVKRYGQPTVIAQSVIPFDPNGTIRGYEYTISGSFTEPSGVTPCSILVDRGKVVFGQACHYWTDRKPESVIFQTATGKLGAKRVLQVSELPLDIRWAVGGMGLLGLYNPVEEGFTGIQASALRKTTHTVLGFKNGLVYGICFLNHTAEELNSIVRDRFKLDAAIMLDGGSPFCYNLAHMTSGLSKPCGYAIQFIEGAK